MVAEVLRILRMYPGMRAMVQRRPRPSHQLAALKPVRKYAEALALAVSELDGMTRTRLRKAGFSESKPLIQALDQLVSSAELVRRELQGLPSRHRPPQEARKQVLSLLAQWFQRNYRGDTRAFRAELCDFIKAASNGAEYETETGWSPLRIPLPSGNQKILQLIPDACLDATNSPVKAQNRAL
jgi:hypothetical protein